MIEATWELIVVIIGIALVFDFTNGFHDSANSISTVVSSTKMPTASAKPPSVIRLIVCPPIHRPTTAAMMAKGMFTTTTSALRTCSRNSVHTSATMIDSWISVSVSVSIARWISSERSYTALISTPSGRPGFSSSIRALTPSITSSAFSPKRATTMPDTTSPSPLSSATPRRSSSIS